MNELATEEMESSNEPIRQEASGCPLQTMHTQRTALDADDEVVLSGPISNHNGACLSPLPPAHSTLPRTWFECETITRELTGDPLELGSLDPFTLVGLRSSVQRIRPAWGRPINVRWARMY